MADLIQLRRDVAQNWTAVNPVLKEGELGIETDTKRFKCGDGTTSWNNLPYFDRNYELDELLERVDEIEGNITTKVQPSGGTFYRYGVPTTDNWCSKFISNNIVGIVVETDDEARKFNLKNPATSGICIASGVGQRWNIVAPNGYRIKTYKIVATLRDGQPEGVVFLTPQGGESFQILPNSDITIEVSINDASTYFLTEDVSTEPLDRQIWFKTFEVHVERTSSLATMDDVNRKQDIISDLTTIRNGAAKGATSLQPTAQTLSDAQKAQARENIGAAALSELADYAKKDDLESGEVIPAMSSTLEAWADQKALAKEDTYMDKVRTSGGSIPLETSEGSKPVSIKPTSDWTAKFFFNGSYNMLKAAKWGNTNTQPMVGGNLTGGCYFLVPKLTLGEFGTATENNGLLFTLEDGTNINPTVYFKALGSTAPNSLTDGTQVTPTQVSFDGKTYYSYECSAAGWFILTYPSGKTYQDICAHIAWEDWYDKYVGLDEEDAPTDPDYNPEAAIGVLMLESFLATGHTDKELYYINDEVRDWIEFGDASAILHNVVDIKATVASDWTNTLIEGGSFLHTASVGSTMKSAGAACLGDGTEVTVEGTNVSFTDANSSVSGDKLNIKYERASENTITKLYTDSVFNGSNINTTSGKLNINDCSIEAQVGASGTAEVTMLYAINTVDKLAMIAQLDFQEMADAVATQELEIEELTSALYGEIAKDPDMKYGQPRILWGDGVPAEATIPANWRQFLDGGYNWIGKPAFVGQVYINTAVTSGGYYVGYKKSDYTLDWRTIVA